MTTIGVVALVCALAQAKTPVPAAQSRRLDPEEVDRQRQLAQASVQQPDAHAGLVLAQPQWTLIAEKGKQSVSGTIGVALDDWALDFNFTGPIGEKDESASPLTLGGLQTGATARFGFSHGSITKQRLTADDVQRITDFCEARGTVDDCDTSDMEPAERAAFIRLFMPKLPIMWGAHLTFGRENFIYSADQGLTDTSEKHTSQSGTFSIGVLTPGLWFFAAHIETQRFTKHGAAAIQVCAPFATAGATTCRSTRTVPPVSVSTELLTLEGRRVFIGRNVGVNPRFVVDLREKTKVFELPVYFLREELDPAKNSVPSLNGGVSVGWHSETGAAIRAFVGVAFKLFDLR